MNTEKMNDLVARVNKHIASSNIESYANLFTKTSVYTELCDDLEDKYHALDKLKEKIKRANRIIAGEIVLLLIILLFAIVIPILQINFQPNLYSAKVKAEDIYVTTSKMSTMTANQLLAYSIENHLVANCLGYYYDPADNRKYDLDNVGNTIYFSIDDLTNQIKGAELNYQVIAVERGKQGWVCRTNIINQDFSYGYRDGSCQTAHPESNLPVFSGYCSTLINRYLEGLGRFAELTTSKAVPIQIDEEIEVDEAFIKAMFDGVLIDNYMANNADTMEDTAITVDDFYYGLKVKDGKLYYLTSHAVTKGSELREKAVEVDISAKVERNIEEYLGHNVKVSFKDSTFALSPKTVIYASTENFAYDIFYIAAINKAYTKEEK